MAVKLFGPGGIDESSNDLLRNPRDLRGSLNVRHNDCQEFVKRPGTEIDNSPAVSTDGNEDAIYIENMDTYFYFDGDNYIDTKKGAVFNFASHLTNGSSKEISYTCTLNNILYTHPNSPFGVMKYDGSSAYLAGLPCPKVNNYTNVIGSGTQVPFVLIYFSSVDPSGIETVGPCSIIKNPTIIYQSGGSDIAKITIDQTSMLGFKRSLLEFSSSSNASYSSNNPTIQFSDCSEDLRSLSSGDKIPFRTMYSYNNSSCKVIVSSNGVEQYYPITLEVESAEYGTPSSGKHPVLITFRASSFKDHRIVFFAQSGSFMNANASMSMKFWYSNSELSGYRTFPATSFRTSICSLPPVSSDSEFDIKYDVSSSGNFIFPIDGPMLSYEYDITTSKLRPPICRYITTHGYNLACASIVGFFNFENYLSSYDNDDLVMFSDLSNGDSYESFSAINRQIIGKSHDGFITGLSSFKDSLIVLKNKGVHSIDGVLIPGQYSIREIPNNKKGTSSFKSILSTDLGVFFQGEDSIYLTNGYSVTNIGIGLQESMKLIDPSSGRSVINFSDDEILIYLKPKELVSDSYAHYFFVYNYRYSTLFWWSGIDASRGLTVSNDGAVHFFGLDDINRKPIPEKVDKHPSDPSLDSPIHSYIRTAWLDYGEPSLLKKMIGFRIFCLNNKGQTVTGRISWDWGAKEDKSPFLIDDFLNPSVKTKNRKIDIQQAQSISLELSNNVINEDMNISGYEIEMALIQNGDRNVK